MDEQNATAEVPTETPGLPSDTATAVPVTPEAPVDTVAPPAATDVPDVTSGPPKGVVRYEIPDRTLGGLARGFGLYVGEDESGQPIVADLGALQAIVVTPDQISAL